jgi:hypothetical protein
MHEDISKASSDDQINLHDGNDILLGFAYDIRKSYSGYREKRQNKYNVDGKSEKMFLYGDNMFLPELLVQVETLKHRLSLLKYEKNQQWIKHNDISVVYALHSALEEILREMLPEETVTQIYTELSAIIAHPFEEISNLLNSRSLYYMNLPSKKRLDALPELLASFTKPTELDFTEVENQVLDLKW